MKLIFLDFEFNGTSQKDLNLVSLAYESYCNGAKVDQRAFWLHLTDWSECRSEITRHVEEGYIFVAFAAEAEVRALLTLAPGLDWVAVKWIDLYLEYRCLLNHNHELMYGLQLIDGKQVKTSPPPNKWFSDFDEDEDLSHHKPQYSLAAATFKLLGKIIDTDEKDRVRTEIIKGDADRLEKLNEDILNYNISDVKHLRALLLRMLDIYKSKGIIRETTLQSAYLRGRYAALTAHMVRLGYPVNLDKLKNFTSHIPEILNDEIKMCVKELATSFKDKKGQWVRDESSIRAWVTEQGKPYWRKTNTGKISISKDAFKDWYDSESEGFGGAFCRYLKTKQSLNGFLPGSKKKFEDFVGSDGRVRPYFGIYGAQSSRSQPGAAGFIPLKSHWMRNFIEAPTGKALVGIDYASQEFLLAAIITQDQAMVDAYASGDVYLTFAKSAGLAPDSATKETHGKVRDLCKALVLGISYEMTAKGLAPRLSQAASQTITEEKAQEYIDLFESTYPDYADWKRQTYQEYLNYNAIVLPDGWVMFGDNDNRRSVLNMPIQGTGAAIMREAVFNCYRNNIDVVFTLHDAIYCEIDYWDLNKIKLFDEVLISSFNDVVKSYGVTIPIRTEGIAWSRSYKDFPLKHFHNTELLGEYTDKKCKKDLERFSKYFSQPS